MSRRYKVAYGGAEWDAQVGDEVALDLTPLDEEELVRRGRIVRLPHQYEVTGDAEVFGFNLGERFEAVLSLGQEAALLEGGHIKHIGAESELTKADLLEQAKSLEIEGRSSMSKDELAAAIAEASDIEKGGNE